MTVDANLDMTDIPLRGKIRHAVALAVDSVTAFNGKVFEDRFYGLNEGEYPAAIIRSGDEAIEPATKSNMQPAIQKLYIETHVYIFYKGQDNIQLETDKLRKLVEEKIFADPTLGGAAVETSLVRTVDKVLGIPAAPISVFDMVFISTTFAKEGLPAKSFNRSNPFN